MEILAVLLLYLAADCHTVAGSASCRWRHCVASYLDENVAFQRTRIEERDGEMAKKATKVTATKCLGGKRHRWKLIATERAYGSEYQTKWCKGCGCLAEFLRVWNKSVTKSRLLRCKNNGSTHIEIPDCNKKG